MMRGAGTHGCASGLILWSDFGAVSSDGSKPAVR
jgi:hypothetical protein